MAQIRCENMGDVNKEKKHNIFEMCFGSYSCLIRITYQPMCLHYQKRMNTRQHFVSPLVIKGDNIVSTDAPSTHPGSTAVFAKPEPIANGDPIALTQ